MNGLIGEGETVAETFADRGACPGGCRRWLPGRDDRPRSSLIGGVKEHRSMPGKPRLQLSDDAVALADAQELVAVIVDGDDPRDLFECELGICRFGALQLDGDLLIGGGLAKDRTGISGAAINWERKPHSAVEANWPAV